MHFDAGPNRSKFVKFGIRAPGPQSAPRGNETATFAKVIVQPSNLRKSVLNSSWVKRESVPHVKPHPQPPYQALAWSYRYVSTCQSEHTNFLSKHF